MQSKCEKAFFRGVALEAWRQITTPEITCEEASFLERMLGVKAGGAILDVPGGNGRHCVQLAKRGYLMTGVDQSEESLSEAQDISSEGVCWVHEDMRRLSWVAEFDGAFCWGNSFCYLCRDEALEFLEALARSLRPGARFILDTGMAAESLLPNLVQRKWFRAGDILMLSENRYDPAESRLDIDYTFVHDGQVETRPTSSYLFTAGEICRLHKTAGLTPLELFGSIGGEPYCIGANRLILVSEKPSLAYDKPVGSAKATCSGNRFETPRHDMVLFDGFQFESNGRFLMYDDQLLEVDPRALQLLAVLVRNNGKVVSKDDLLSFVWPHTIVEEGNLAVHVSSLRKVLSQPGRATTYIQTVRKHGYRFTARIRNLQIQNPRQSRQSAA